VLAHYYLVLEFYWLPRPNQEFQSNHFPSTTLSNSHGAQA
jgi:hypothetical protein